MTINYTTTQGIAGVFTTDCMQFIEESTQKQVRQLFNQVVHFADDVKAVTSELLGEITDGLQAAETALDRLKGYSATKSDVSKAERLVKRLRLAETLCRKERSR